MTKEDVKRIAALPLDERRQHQKAVIQRIAELRAAGMLPVKRRVSLCLHYIDASQATGHADGKDWRKCVPASKDVCPCRDCATGCEHYVTA